MTPIETIQNELDNHINELNEDCSHYKDELTNYDEDNTELVSNLIKDADLESIDFNIGHEQGYIRGLEVALSLLTTNTNK